VEVHGCEAGGVDRDQAGWDVAGAKWFGYPTFWNNRGNRPAERLDAVPDGSGPTLVELSTFLGNK
jgi:2-haloacid dehalogenase